MAKRAIVRIGDPTTHGGVVMTGISKYNVYGKEAAGIGDTVFCPRCEGHHVIVGGVHTPKVFGRQVAVEGMFTSCGAQVISTLPDVVFDVPDGKSGEMPQSTHKKQASEGPFYVQFQLTSDEAAPYTNTWYTAKMPTGELIHGVTDDQGMTQSFTRDTAEQITVLMGHLEA